MSDVIFIKKTNKVSVYCNVEFTLFSIKFVETVEYIGKIHYSPRSKEYLFKPISFFQLSIEQDTMEKIVKKLNELNKKR
jgi:uncharacterized protein YlbG (UPF0298 family)